VTVAPRSSDDSTTVHVAPLASIPIAALYARGDRIVAVNAAYEELMSIRAEDVVGRSIADLSAQFVKTPDHALVGTATKALEDGRLDDGHLWIRVIDNRGNPRSVRVVWEAADAAGGLVIYMIEAANEAAAKSLAEALARAGGDLVRCRDEEEVLERAADALFAQGMSVMVFLIHEGDPRLSYGPTRSPASGVGMPSPALSSLMEVRPSREILSRFNRDFDKRRAVFLQEIAPLVDAAYPADVAADVKSRLPARRSVQAPVFVDEAAYGAFVVTSDDLSPALAGSIEMFVSLVARAIENVRLHRRAAGRLEELERLQGELLVSERLAALGEAAAVMAHEVRNPVAAITNAVALLRRGSEASEELLRVIDEEAARLERMVSDLLDLGRPLSPKFRLVDLFDLATESALVLRARHECEGVTVDVEKPSRPVGAEVDPDLVQLAILNVIRNAAQASPPGGRVVVRVETRGDRAAIVVDDEGSGFPTYDMDQLLEPFFTTRATGTGIGLAVVRRVLEANEGTIEIGTNPRGGGRLEMIFRHARSPRSRSGENAGTSVERG
jgi:two-component system sensor histidine kinase HydH